MSNLCTFFFEIMPQVLLLVIKMWVLLIKVLYFYNFDYAN